MTPEQASRFYETDENPERITGLFDAARQEGRLSRTIAPRSSARLVMSQADINRNPERWHAERRRDSHDNWRLTASQMSAVMNLAPPDHGSAFSLYFDKLTGQPWFGGNQRTRFGSFCEDFIAESFAASYPDLLLNQGGFYVSRDYPWLGATFDRIAYYLRDEAGVTLADELAGPVQIKTWMNRADFGDPGTDVMPRHIRIQVLTEMIVLDADHAWIPVIFDLSGRVVIFEITRTAAVEAEMALILKAGQEFIYRLDTEEPPPVDWTPATAATLRKLYPPDRLEDTTAQIPARLASRLTRARRAHKKAEKRYKLAQNQVRELAGNARCVVAYDPLTKKERTVVTRRGGPKRGFTVAPQEWVEVMDAGDWGTPPRSTGRDG